MPVVGRDPDSELVVGRHLDKMRDLNVRMSPDIHLSVQKTPDDERVGTRWCARQRVVYAATHCARGNALCDWQHAAPAGRLPIDLDSVDSPREIAYRALLQAHRRRMPLAIV